MLASGNKRLFKGATGARGHVQDGDPFEKIKTNDNNPSSREKEQRRD